MFKLPNHPPTNRMINRRNIFLTAALGLLGAIIITVVCVYLILNDSVPILINNLLLTQATFISFLVLSVLEIPLMIFGMRQMQNSVNQKAGYALLLTNISYPFFGGVYACCFILLTGQVWFGSGLALLSFVRFATALIFLGHPKRATDDTQKPPHYTAST